MKQAILITLFFLGSSFCSGAYESGRPEQKLFVSDAVESKIVEVCSQLTNPRLAWMFSNCFPNTLDTTVHYSEDEDGNPDTFVYTGDIHAMWLRDSGAQVWPYVRFASDDPKVQKMLKGVILRQFRCINIDPYANAFNFGPTGGEWQSDGTEMNLNDHERKWELDSHCYPIRLAYAYWKQTGDASIFGEEWNSAIRNILRVMREQQRKEGLGSYSFTRRTDRQYDTKACGGFGNPVKPCGLVASSFRPSDDATVFDFLIPSNFFAVSSLKKAAEIIESTGGDKFLASECLLLSDEIHEAIMKYAVVRHPVFGKIYAYEVDGFGNHLLMDDANVPSLLAMAYLGDVPANDPIYRNTRKFVLSEYNPYFFKGTAGEGVGGPHVGYDMIWPMSIMMRAFTSTDDKEIAECVRMLMTTDAGTGFMHESFHKDNPSNYTRSWFAWQNTLFGELIIHLIDSGKLDLLNSIETNPYTFFHQGKQRSYYLYLPDNPLPQRPLIMHLHGYTGRAESESPEMINAALRAGYAICVPQGAKDAKGNYCWNVGYCFQNGLETDDVDFVCSLARFLQKKYELNPSNTFVMGMSNGGEMCYLIAYMRPEFFAALASIAGLTMRWMPDSLSITHPVNLMEVHGTDDTISMWNGDPQNTGGWGAYLTVPDAVQAWADAAGSVEKTTEPFNEKVLLHNFTGGSKDVLLYEVTGGDHSWSMHSMDTPSVVISFFNAHLSASGASRTR